MRVRIRKSDKTDDSWIIEVWRWWWPLWMHHDSWTNHDNAVKFAGLLLHPEITEVK